MKKKIFTLCSILIINTHAYDNHQFIEADLKYHTFQFKPDGSLSINGYKIVWDFKEKILPFLTDIMMSLNIKKIYMKDFSHTVEWIYVDQMNTTYKWICDTNILYEESLENSSYWYYKAYLDTSSQPTLKKRKCDK